MSDATIGMSKKDGAITCVMVSRSKNVKITLETRAEATPEEMTDMVDEFPDAVFAVIAKAMAEADKST